MMYFMIYVVIFLVIVEVITVLFKLTGLSEDKSRFQVISLLTGSGFTTKESELITQHPGRRKLAQILMITGYIGFFTGISFIIDLIEKSLSVKNFLVLMVFFWLIWLFFKNRFLLTLLDNLIEKLILRKRFKFGNPNKMYKLITRAKGYGVFNIFVDDNSSLIGIALKDANLKPRKMIVLNVDKGDEFIGFPTSNYVIEKGDNLLIYGKIDEVIQTFHIKVK